MDVKSMCIDGTPGPNPNPNPPRPSPEGNTSPKTDDRAGPKATSTKTTRTRATTKTTAKTTRRAAKRQPKSHAQRTLTPPTTNANRGGPSRRKTCSECGKTISHKAFADHLKVHMLDSDEHGVTAVRPCRNCIDKGRECRVAIHPGAKGVNTFRCMRCLLYHETCSYMIEARGRRVEPDCVHPGMVTPPASDTDPSAGTGSPKSP